MKITDYKQLEVWQLARGLTKKLYIATQSLPEEEKFGLISQLRRAAVSVPSNIAEGWGRHYTAEFIQFLRKANGSRTEIETQLILCCDLEYLREQDIAEIFADITVLGKKLLALERSLQPRE